VTARARAHGVLFLALAASAAHAAAPAAQEWATIARLPDLSGVWLPDVADQDRQITSNPPPWNTAAAAQAARLAAEEEAGRPFGLFEDCLPHGMPSWMLENHNAMEVLVTPGRVTLLGEGDGNRLRRVYTDGRALPADPDLSFHGYSVGQWRGDALEIDTVGVLPQSYIAISEAVGIPNNGDMRIHERLHLVRSDELHDDLEITAPHVLTRPWKTTRVFRRSRDRRAEVLEGVCLQGGMLEDTDKNGNSVFRPQPRTTH
jgi:hypothetical protein